MKNRQAFVRQVAETIKERHGIGSESFVFGISGKWGEGKTTFLNDLEDALGADFLVVRVEPWKYASDRTSLLRSFLRSIDGALPWWRRRLVRAVGRVRRHRSLADMTYDTSSSRVAWGKALFGLFVLAGAYYFYEHLISTGARVLISDNKTFLTLLALPASIPILNKLTVNQLSNRSLTTLDEFDDLLNDLLWVSFGRKMVIFVDDLDRISESSARQVLDSLRTFFDKRGLSYVVTADHSVLERGIGRGLCPDDSEKQLVEGRKFLKKIFSIYWRLPLPTSSDLSAYVTEEIEKRHADLDECGVDETRRTVLATWLVKYFEKNLRNIERFLDLAIFTLQGVRQQLPSTEEIEGMEDGESACLREMASHPLLVVRVLMYQELCTPLFDEMLSDSSLANTFEVAADSGQVTDLIDSLKVTPDQRRFAIEFAAEKPRFVEDKNRRVRDIQSFLLLAGDVTFSDHRGPDPEEYTRLLKLDDVAAVNTVVKGAGHERLLACARCLPELIDEAPEVGEKALLLNKAISALLPLAPDHEAHAVFGGVLAEVDLSWYEQLDSPSRVTAFSDFWWKWIDRIPALSLDTYGGIFAFRSSGDLSAVRRELLNSTATIVVAQWIVTLFESEPDTALQQLNELSEYLARATALKVIGSLSGLIIESIKTVKGDESKDLRLHTIEKFFKGTSKSFREAILQAVLELDEDLWAWAESRTQAGFKAVPTLADITGAILSAIKDQSDPHSLVEALRFADGKIDAGPAWDYLLQEQKELLLGALPELVLQSDLGAMALDPRQAAMLFGVVYEFQKMLDDPGQRAQLVQCLDKGRWIWSKTSKKDLGKPGPNVLVGLSGSREPALKNAATAVRQSWADRVL